MKKYIVLFISLLLCLGLFGCIKSNDTKSIDKKETPLVLNEESIVSNSDVSVANINHLEEILSEINERAKLGMILNVDFKAKDDVLDRVRTLWGKEDKREIVEEAKGTYATYTDKNTVFGLNKGEQIFEIRSYSKGLKSISYKDVLNYYGEPPYNVVTKNKERIIGYKVSEEFKLEFVFKNPNGEEGEQSLDHYGVFYPKGTVNNMSGDKGREW